MKPNNRPFPSALVIILLLGCCIVPFFIPEPKVSATSVAKYGGWTFFTNADESVTIASDYITNTFPKGTPSQIIEWGMENKVVAWADVRIQATLESTNKPMPGNPDMTLQFTTNVMWTLDTAATNGVPAKGEAKCDCFLDHHPVFTLIFIAVFLLALDVVSSTIMRVIVLGRKQNN